MLVLRETVIIGNGDIASVLTDRDDRLYFASGVSNSQETRESEYRREIDLLLEQNKGMHIVYFSSLAVFDPPTRYTDHKKRMESLVKKYFENYTVIRIGNISWGSNPHTIINHFKEQIRRDEKLEIHDVYRYIISKEEFLHYISIIPKWSCEMTLFGRRMHVKDIVKEIKSGKL